MLHKLGVFCDISPTSFSLSIFQVLSALLEHQSVTILSLIVPQFIAAITLCSNNYCVFFIVFIALLGKDARWRSLGTNFTEVFAANDWKAFQSSFYHLRNFL
jgi:hypothetical protein